MIDRFTSTLTCLNEDCPDYLIPVEVGMVRELDTGARYAARRRDEWCEGCEAQRQEAIEGVSPETRRRYAEAT